MNLNEESGVVLAPDVGSAAMSQSYAKKAGLGFALIDKRRKKHNEAEVANLIGDLENKHAIIIDDMIDTAGTICNAANTAINKELIQFLQWQHILYYLVLQLKDYQIQNYQKLLSQTQFHLMIAKYLKNWKKYQYPMFYFTSH